VCCAGHAQVETTIRELGLEIATHTKVGDVFYKGCSGGQKRRVSIGVELLKQPCTSRGRVASGLSLV
jgi:ABC-type multidrug transport system ATPase subunit